MIRVSPPALRMKMRDDEQKYEIAGWLMVDGKKTKGVVTCLQIIN